MVALDKLGADFRWQTRVLCGKSNRRRNIKRRFDSLRAGRAGFSSEGVENLVSQLQAKGLKKIKGNIVGDESFFKGDTVGDGWTWNELQWYYGAEASALSINFNQA